ncbi:hypothetical protein D3C87_1372890 [compost metagenome]
MIGHATPVTGGVPGIVGVGGVLHQGFEERWQQTIQIFACGPRHLPCEERHGVFKQIENAAQLIQFGHRVGGRIFQGHLLAEGEDRQIRRTHPRQSDQLSHVL